MGPGCLTDEAMAEVLRLINKVMEEYFQKAQERLEQRKDEDYDEVSVIFLIEMIQRKR